MTKLCLGLCLPLALVLVACAVHPALDLAVARFFYEGGGRFVGNTPTGVVVRYAAWYLPFATYLALALAWVAARFGRAAVRWAPRGPAMLFLTLSFALCPGPLLVQPLKFLTHRPRPYSVAAFGGPDSFRPLGAADGACRRSCSFPSAETAAATWMIAPASLLPAPWRGPALGVALVYAVATGILRMAFGGHFLSDVCAGMLLTLLVLVATRRLTNPRAEEG